MIPLELTAEPTPMDRDTVLTAGLRAMWLHLMLTSPAADALSPRERELLTLVATNPQGATAKQCSRQLRLGGLDEHAATRVHNALVQGGWLVYRIGPGEHQVLDLIEEDRVWIAQQVHQMTNT